MFIKSKDTTLTGLLEISVINLFFLKFSRIELLQNRSATILKIGSNLPEKGTESEF